MVLTTAPKLARARAWNYRHLMVKYWRQHRRKGLLAGLLGTIADRPASLKSRILQRRNASAGFQLVLTIVPKPRPKSLGSEADRLEKKDTPTVLASGGWLGLVAEQERRSKVALG
jgi:hypothetical protein